MKHRLLAFFLVLVLAVGLIPTVSAASSQSSIDRQEIIDAAVYFFAGYEGNYTDVYRKDSNAVSVGRLQWHGSRAHALLAKIIARNPSKMKPLLSVSLYDEITKQTDASWNNRSVTAEEAAQLVLVLGTPEGIEVQDEQAQTDISSYIDHAWNNYGLRSNATILYYCTIENQYGIGGAKKVMNMVRETMGLPDEISSLEQLHCAFLETPYSSVQNYISYRKSTYSYIATLGWNMNGLDSRSANSRPGAIFRDVSANAWFSGAVDFAVARGLFNGTSDTTFSPADTMTRAMLVTVLHRLAGCPSVSGSSGFSDVDESSWYGKAVAWAVKRNIVTGVSAGKFAPNAPVTREQIALILYNYTRSIGKLGKVCNTSLGGFADGARVSDFAQTAMLWAVQQGVIKGDQSGSQYYLKPGSSATRAEVATMLMRFARAYYR